MKMPTNVRTFIYYWSAFLVMFGACAFWVLSKAVKIDFNQIEAKLFILGLCTFIATWPIITALGLILKQKWAYHSWKAFLILLYPAFPIGTYAAKASFKFIKEENISAYFCKEKAT